jgi:thioredoxin-related protein
MSRTASAESQLCSSLASGLSVRSIPVFVFYSLKAASRIALNCEDETGVSGDEDMRRFVSEDNKSVLREAKGVLPTSRPVCLVCDR